MKQKSVLQRTEPRNDPHHKGRCLSWKNALVCIDLQYLSCHDGYGIFSDHKKLGLDEEVIEAYMDRMNNVVLGNVAKLQHWFRKNGDEVIHVRIQSKTKDGRDRSLEHKELNLHAPPGSRLAEFLPQVAPVDNEIVINKTASGVFISTNLEYILRNLCVSEVMFTGVFTNECISSAVRSASDLGFQVYLVSDATAATTKELHDATLVTTDKRYAKVLSTDEVIDYLEKQRGKEELPY